MLTLAIDTATKICTVALCRDQQLLAEYNVNVGMTHSEGLLPQLEQLLKRTGIKKNEIELLNDDDYVARYARENYVFTREGEQVSIIPEVK